MRLSELKEACRVRGMRFYGLSETRLREQLQQWLDLSIVKKIPPSLLLLSQAFSLTNKLPNEKALAATISSLPTEVGTATRAALSEREGKLDYETEIRLLKDELLKIAEENRESQLEHQKKMESFMIDPKDEASEQQKRYEIMKKKLFEDLTIDELTVLEEALGLNLYIEKDCLAELKNDLENYEQKIKELKEVMSKLKLSDVLVETLAAKRLHRKILMITQRLDEALVTIENREATRYEEPQPDYKAKRAWTRWTFPVPALVSCSIQTSLLECISHALFPGDSGSSSRSPTLHASLIRLPCYSVPIHTEKDINVVLEVTVILGQYDEVIRKRQQRV
ncbi:unnamed protein product [Nezara viridula]|uniref:Letm1 RBD domain-containing protein n=1 Tax=Nezara viridula TaxID=85310 RepID=A0A9P0MKR9_NEZVI|nr:unnamed protein product [Nezara viridula]